MALYPTLPPKPGPEREQAIVDYVAKGNFPSFLTDWIEVPISGGGLTASVFVSPDYFGIGSSSSFLRTPMTPATAETIGAMVGARLPTRKLVRDLHAVAPQKLAAFPIAPDSAMSWTDRFVKHNNYVQSEFNQKGFHLGKLTSGHKKDIVVSPKMDGKHVCIYGWFKTASPGSAIQGPLPNCKTHSAEYSDYSHGARLIRDTMLVGGKQMLVDDVMRDPELFELVSDEGIFGNKTRYTKSVGTSIPATGVGSPTTGTLLTGLVFFALGYVGTQAFLG